MSNDSEIDQTKIPPVPWNPWLGLVYAIGLYYGAQVLSGIYISIYPVLRHWSDQQALNWINHSIAAQFGYVFVTEGVTLLGIYIFLRQFKVGFAQIGLKRPRWLDPVYGLSALPLYIILYLVSVVLIQHLVPHLNVNQTQQIGFNGATGQSQLFMAFISLVLLPPLVEEVTVRGFLYSSLKKALPTAYAVILTSAIFASAHLQEGGSAGPLYIAAIDTFVLSLVLIYLREKTGSLWPCITLHALKNGIAFVALFVIHAH